ncbi:beta strand repeat-containing protein [Neopusillimonas aromaticivorans]|uniref:beta strand repeat-containing protein n=1 Tax=Neopusillimonas aromaticivorans TaxID=2979868 RepID=UPI00259451A0|nr:hypothetical protein [Neopusillimonas aromaticivorans]WJJ94717.1 hypothetical protein N7E01_07380 [Neopusillimonas aromaticivorans]
MANASAGDAAGISIQHSATNNNNLNQNAIVLDVADGVTTAAVEIVEGVNADPRFNFSLQADSNLTFNATTGAITAGSLDAVNAVVNVTLTDSDSESNTVRLVDVAAHTGTLTVSGGVAGTFLNLDARSANNTAEGGYGYVTNGANGSATTVVAAATVLNPAIVAAGLVQPSARDAAVNSVFNTVVGDQALVFTNIAASEQVSDLVVRLGQSNTNAQLGSGNDTVIFAARAGVSAGTSGLTIQDTVAGGAGTDTIVLDGTGAMTLGASEWTNLSGVDVIRLAGTAGSTFDLRVTDQLVNQADAGNRITIVNNDGDLTGVAENAATINLRALSATNNVTFVGANGDGAAAEAGRSAQTVILNDVTANGSNTLNGGDRDIITDYASVGAGRQFATAAAADLAWTTNLGTNQEGNNNVLQIFNNAEVTIGDLANTSNFSTINFVNDVATAQTLNLTLDNATVDRLVDASHTATATQVETLVITATDNVAVPLATANLNVQAGTLGAQFALNVTGGAGADVIVAGAAGADVMTGGAGADTFAYASATIVGLTAEGGDTITDFLSLTDIISFADLSADAGFTVGTAAVAGETLLVSAGNAGVADINFVSGAGAVALSAESTLIFDTTTRTLSFDADGTGLGAAAVAIVTVGVGQTIVAGDIVIA